MVWLRENEKTYLHWTPANCPLHLPEASSEPLFTFRFELGFSPPYERREIKSKEIDPCDAALTPATLRAIGEDD
ncbi:hypothetical protein KY289_037829 [Solanum tuberosum]|nr:hypothetical protein KY289_037829 [Solanum tuberosum]